jgi:hypothetical protein
VFAAGAAILCYMAISPAEAHDASHPELDGWYEKLESGKGPCCDGSDSTHVEPSDWETQNKPRSHYKVRLDGVWADVPDEAVVTGPNRDGRTLVWYYDSWTGHSGIPGKVIKCFMPGTMTWRRGFQDKLLARRPDGIFVAPFEQGEIGPDLFRKACEFGLEGMVCKRADRPYQAGRSKHWMKVKNRKHPAMERVMDALA